MKNITLTVDDETYRAARIRAAELGTSVSALVKQYLARLADGEPQQSQGVRDMQTQFRMPDEALPFVPVQKGAAKGPEGQPFFVNGNWVFTKDGKPRKPGSLRHLGALPDDWDEWPPEMEEFFDKLQSDPWDENGFDGLK